jgi:hypothetical protein
MLKIVYRKLRFKQEVMYEFVLKSAINLYENEKEQAIKAWH